jgi:signal transduction histidine kinase
MTLLQHYQLSLLLTTLVTWTFGLWVFIKQRHSKVAQTFCLYSLAVGFWSLCQAQAGSSNNPEISLAWIRAGFYSIITFPVLLTHFFSAYLKIDQRKVCRIGWLLVFSLLPFVSSNLFLRQGGPLGFLPSMPRAGALFILFNPVWAGWILYDLWLLTRQLRSSTQPKLGQTKLLLATFIFGYLTGCTNYLYFYGICIQPLQPFACYGVPLAFLIIAYGVFAYGLFDIQVVIRRSVLYSLLTALLVAGYFGLVYAAQRLFHMTLLQHHILALCLTAVTTFGLGLLVFLADPKRRLNQIFGIYSLAISWWATNESFMVSAFHASAANFWAYVKWPGFIFIAPTFLHTVFLLTGERSKSARAILRIGYVSGFVLLVLHLVFQQVARPSRPVAYTNYFTELTPVGFFIPALFLILVNLGLWKLLQSYRRSIGRQRTQLKYLFWASVVAYLGSGPNWFLVFGFYVPLLNPFGIYTVPLYSIATTYAVLQHRLFDVNLVIRKSLVYSSLVTTLTVGYFGLVLAVERLSQITLGYQSIWISLGSFALMALFFQPLKVAIQRGVDWLLLGAPHEEMVKRVERFEKEVQQTEKFKSVATLAAGLSHELKGPMQAIQTYAEFLPDSYDNPEFRERCSRVMKTEIIRVNNLIKQLMEFAKPKTPSLRPIEPHKIVDSTLDLLSNEFVIHSVNLEKNYLANGAQIQADPDQLRQVTFNLVLNALEATEKNGRITVTTRQDDGWFVLEVSDTGPGIDPAILPKLFKPFETTKPTGTGLGLSVVHGIIREHHGKISVQSEPGQGATFTVKLPIF